MPNTHQCSVIARTDLNVHLVNLILPNLSVIHIIPLFSFLYLRSAVPTKSWIWNLKWQGWAWNYCKRQTEISVAYIHQTLNIGDCCFCCILVLIISQKEISLHFLLYPRLLPTPTTSNHDPWQLVILIRTRGGDDFNTLWKRKNFKDRATYEFISS